jgi:hypothetical protein
VLINHYRATGSGEAVKTNDFLSQRQFHRLGLHAELSRSIPVEHQIVGLRLDRIEPFSSTVEPGQRPGLNVSPVAALAAVAQDRPSRPTCRHWAGRSRPHMQKQRTSGARGRLQPRKRRTDRLQDQPSVKRDQRAARRMPRSGWPA